MIPDRWVARRDAYERLREKYPDALPAAEHVSTGSRITVIPDEIPTLSIDIPLGLMGTPTLAEALAVFADRWTWLARPTPLHCAARGAAPRSGASCPTPRWLLEWDPGEPT